MNILVRNMSSKINTTPLKLLVNVESKVFKHIPKLDNNIYDHHKNTKNKQIINTKENNYDWLMRIMKEDKKDDMFLL